VRISNESASVNDGKTPLPSINFSGLGISKV
jgi:hypothetical protein